MMGCRLIGIEDPAREIKKLMVFVEIDRCACDTIAAVTGCKLGRRSLKYVDHGILAATFLNLETGLAYRIAATEKSRDLATLYAPGIQDARRRQLEAYRIMSASVLFKVRPVRVDLQALDLPGPTRRRVLCEACGETVRDGKEVLVNGRVLCRPCAGMGYFLPKEVCAEGPGRPWRP